MVVVVEGRCGVGKTHNATLRASLELHHGFKEQTQCHITTCQIASQPLSRDTSQNSGQLSNCITVLGVGGHIM